MPGSFDFHSRDHFMRPESKDPGIRRPKFIEIFSPGIDHFEDMKNPGLGFGNPILRHQASNRGPHDGKIDIQSGQRPVKIENDGLDRSGVEWKIHRLSFR